MMRKREGTTYIVVLMASLIVSSLALAAIESSRWYMVDANNEADYLKCYLSADNAMEIAIAKVSADPNWRTNHTSGISSSPITIGGTTYSYRLTDEDGNLNDDPFDRCKILVTATVGNISRSWEATVQPLGDPLDCLLYSLASDKTVKVDDYGLLGTDQSIGANDKIDVASANAYLSGNSHVVNTASGNVYGPVQNLTAPINIPNQSALDYYIGIGTEILINDLPEIDGRRVISGNLLSATTNTINGALNSEGVYYIACGGQEVRIEDSRLRCTLVLINPHNNSHLQGNIHWEAHVTNYPILLVDGEIDINMERAPLKESEISVNLNPAGTPYRGQTDGNTSTVYPSVLKGLIYAHKRIEFKNSLGETFIQGLVIGYEDIDVLGDVLIQYRDVYFNDPPPGFSTGSIGIRIIPGTVASVPTP